MDREEIFEEKAAEIFQAAVDLRFYGSDPLELVNDGTKHEISRRLRDLMDGYLDELIEREQDRVEFDNNGDPNLEDDKERFLDLLEDMKGAGGGDRAEIVEDIEDLSYLA